MRKIRTFFKKMFSRRTYTTDELFLGDHLF